MRHTHGSIEVVCGSMFSGKTDELIRRLVRATIAKQKVQVFKPAIDVRYAVEKVTSHAGSNFDATPVEKSMDVLTKLESDTTVVAIDEAQFFDPEIVSIVQQLAALARACQSVRLVDLPQAETVRDHLRQLQLRHDGDRRARRQSIDRTP